MSDAAALLAAIRAAPDDDAPRLIYADWLEERGQPERAEFIRVQCELARNDSPTLRQREAELLTEHGDSFLGPLKSTNVRFRFLRGFIAGFGHVGVFVSRVDSSPFLQSYLRFFPDGVVLKAQTGRDINEYIRIANNLSVSDHTSGKYRLDGTRSPMHIRFDLNPQMENSFLLPASMRESTYYGRFDGRAISFEVRLHTIGGNFREEYTHQPVPGFDSFQDSPYDAIR